MHGSDSADRLPLWVLALGATLGMQTVASFLDQSLPIIGPLLTADAGLAPERIGNISSLNSLGTILFLLFGAPILARLGPVRTLQLGALLAVAGLIVASSGSPIVIVFAAILMGMGYGPSPPAGTRILTATAPAQHRTLIFSIKQAGAPAGGALAGLLLAPAAAAWGWPSALVISIMIGLAAIIIVEPARQKLDLEKEPDRSIRPAALFKLGNVLAPFQLLRRSPMLLSVTGLAFSFAIVQGSLFSFSITYLVTDRHMPMASAGVAYAAMQFSGVFARIFLGWLADRTGRPALNLTIQALAAAVLVVIYGRLPVDVSLPVAGAIAAGTGFLAASWNGIYMAEVARLSDRAKIVETASSSVLLTFLGYVSGPTLFSLLATWTASYTIPFDIIALQLAAMGLVQVAVLIRRSRRSRDQRSDTH
jgi:MFS family permease